MSTAVTRLRLDDRAWSARRSMVSAATAPISVIRTGEAAAIAVPSIVYLATAMSFRLVLVFLRDMVSACRSEVQALSARRCDLIRAAERPEGLDALHAPDPRGTTVMTSHEALRGPE